MGFHRPHLVLHAGTHKTGSTAIQSFLAAHRDQLAEQGVLYPVLDGDGLSHTSLQKHVGLACTTGGSSQLDATLAQLAKQIDEAQPQRVVLSSEHFFAMPRAWITPLLTATKPLFASVSLVIYLRSQRDLWTSLFNQRAKALKVLPSHQPWGTTDFLGPAIVENMAYADYLDAFACEIGTDQIAARLYDPSQFPGGDVRLNFLESAGVSPFPHDTSDTRAVNPSLGWKGVALATTLAARYHAIETRPLISRAMRRAFQQAHNEGLPDWLGAAACYLTAEEQLAIRETYTASNLRLADTYSEDFDLFLSEHPRPQEERGLAAIDPSELRRVNNLIGEQLTTLATDTPSPSDTP